MTGIYMSGTGNTRHCIMRLMDKITGCAKVFAIEDPDSVNALRDAEEVVLAYPTQFSNIPYMVRDYINKNASLWQDKKVICMATMGAFSGDGAGCAARLLTKYGAKIVGGVHIKMPDAVSDSKMLKRSQEENERIVREADLKIDRIAEQMKDGIYPRDGLSAVSHVVGLFGQRLWFYSKTQGYKDNLKISDVCCGCGLCAEGCPMGNIRIVDGKACAGKSCAMCYRCISRCPKKAITLLGKEVVEQMRYDRYASETE